MVPRVVSSIRALKRYNLRSIYVKVLAVMEARDLADHAFRKSSVTKLMTYGRLVIEDERGLRLGELHQFIYRLFRSEDEGWSEALHKTRRKGGKLLLRSYE
jgi:hypothetical protein